MEGSDVPVEYAPADFDGWDLERVNDLFPNDKAGELSNAEWNELTKRVAASTRLNDLEELKRYEIGKIYDEIVAERGADPLEWKVDYIHAGLLESQTVVAASEVDAINLVTASTNGEVGPRSVTSINGCAISEEVYTAATRANRSEEVFDVEYQEGDGFCHSFFKARDGDEAARKAMVKHNLHPRDIVGATKCNESLGKIQHRLIWANGETLLRERGHEFLTGSMLEEIPDLYATESTPLADKMIHAHYFSSNGDWYIAELDKNEGGIAFGHCDLGVGYPEWGEVSLTELEGVRSQYGIAAVERDLDFTPATAKQLGLTRDDN
jgi:hypothetical protein